MESRRGLTGQEERVAQLVAVGWTNKEIAAELDLSPKTVEWHLSHVLRKLGLRSRVELAARVGALRAQGFALGQGASEDESSGPLSALLANGIDRASSRDYPRGGEQS